MALGSQMVEIKVDKEKKAWQKARKMPLKSVKDKENGICHVLCWTKVGLKPECCEAATFGVIKCLSTLLLFIICCLEKLAC